MESDEWSDQMDVYKFGFESLRHSEVSQVLAQSNYARSRACKSV